MQEGKRKGGYTSRSGARGWVPETIQEKRSRRRRRRRGVRRRRRRALPIKYWNPNQRRFWNK